MDLVWKLIRANNWWHDKLPMFLGFSYLLILGHDEVLTPYFFPIFLILLTIIVGASFVSLLNDYTDLTIDHVAGKIEKPTPLKRQRKMSQVIIIGFLLVVMGGFVYRGFLSALFFFYLSVVAFCLYSLPPFRWKDRGILGVLCDAIGAVLAPQLLFIFALASWYDWPMDAVWLSALAILSLSVGMRGILWHQYDDRDNDIITKTQTFATQVDFSHVKKYEWLFIAVELLCFSVLGKDLPLLMLSTWLSIYLGMALFNRIRYGERLVVVISDKTQSYQLVLLDFFSMVFPLGVLVWATWNNQENVIPLFIHLLLFHTTPKRYAQRILQVLRN